MLFRSVEFSTDDAEKAKAVTSLTFSGDIALNRAGEFTLRITLTDRMSKKTAKLEAPLKVVAP